MYKMHSFADHLDCVTPMSEHFLQLCLPVNAGTTCGFCCMFIFLLALLNRWFQHFQRNPSLSQAENWFNRHFILKYLADPNRFTGVVLGGSGWREVGNWVTFRKRGGASEQEWLPLVKQSAEFWSKTNVLMHGVCIQHLKSDCDYHVPLPTVFPPLNTGLWKKIHIHWFSCAPNNSTGNMFFKRIYLTFAK